MKTLFSGAWIYVFIASIMEIFWTYSLKAIDEYKLFRWPNEWDLFIYDKIKFLNVLPLLGYIGFGILNVYFISKAFGTIPVSVAFAVWTAFVLIGTKLVDTFLFKEPTSWAQIGWTTLIMIGIIGLRYSTNFVK